MEKTGASIRCLSIFFSVYLLIFSVGVFVAGWMLFTTVQDLKHEMQLSRVDLKMDALSTKEMKLYHKREILGGGDLFKGEKGETGPPGPPGPKGQDGQDGKDGAPGLDGSPGAQGSAGRNGDKGDRGPMGPPGYPGTPGATGAPGMPGRDGRDAMNGPGSLISLGSGGSHPPHTVITRWGVNSCGRGNLPLYSGYMAATPAALIGGSPTPLCLPTAHSSSSSLPSARTTNILLPVVVDVTSVITSPLGPLNRQALQCVMCEYPQSQIVMLPATTACPPGWTALNHGWLMSASQENDKRSLDMVCLDVKSVATAISVSQAATFIDHVVMHCTGCSPLPNYTAHKPLECVICAK